MNLDLLYGVIAPQLRNGEKPVWIDRPSPMARALSSPTKFLFGIPFLGFAIFWTSTASQTGVSFFTLWGIPFILVGAGMVLSPVWYYLEAKNWLYYAITDQRALIIRTFPRHKIESFEPREFTRLERTVKPDGTGNVLFAEDIRRGKNGNYTVPRGFYGVPEAKRVEETLLDLQRNSTAV